MSKQPVADERELSIATMRPTLRQQRLALAIIGILSVGFAAIAPFAAKQVVQIASFVPTVQAIIFVTSLATTVLLFSQFSILGLRELLLLASGYLPSAASVTPARISLASLLVSIGSMPRRSGNERPSNFSAPIYHPSLTFFLARYFSLFVAKRFIFCLTYLNEVPPSGEKSSPVNLWF